MHSTIATSALLLAASTSLVAANGYQPTSQQVTIAYQKTVDNSTQPTAFVDPYWNQNYTLTNIEAAWVWILNGNDATPKNGFSCIFNAGGATSKYSGVRTITSGGPRVNLATNPINVDWICCGEQCADKAKAAGVAVGPTSAAGAAKGTGVSPAGVAQGTGGAGVAGASGVAPGAPLGTGVVAPGGTSANGNSSTTLSTTASAGSQQTGGAGIQSHTGGAGAVSATFAGVAAAVVAAGFFAL